MTFSFWTSSDFEPKALECLLYHKKRNTKITLDWKNGRDILAIVKEDKLNSIADVLQNTIYGIPWRLKPISWSAVKLLFSYVAYIFYLWARILDVFVFSPDR
jgi:hypothetical protein